MTRAVLVLAALGLAACSQSAQKHLVERLEVPETRDPGVGEAISAASIERALTEALRTEGHFELPSDPKPAGKAKDDPKRPRVRVSVDLDLTDEGRKPGLNGRYAQVGATLRMRVRSDKEPLQLEAFGAGDAEIEGDQKEQVQSAVQRALKQALASAATAAHLALRAAAKSDSELLKDLGEPDLRTRRAAARALADRKNPAALPPLLDQLKDLNVEEVRRAIGALIELKDPRAAPGLIELARAKESSFMREIIFALGAIGGDEAQAYLYTLAQGHDEPVIRAAAQQAFDEVRARSNKAAAP